MSGFSLDISLSAFFSPEDYWPDYRLGMVIVDF